MWAVFEHQCGLIVEEQMENRVCHALSSDCNDDVFGEVSG